MINFSEFKEWVTELPPLRYYLGIIDSAGETMSTMLKVNLVVSEVKVLAVVDRYLASDWVDFYPVDGVLYCKYRNAKDEIAYDIEVGKIGLEEMDCRSNRFDFPEGSIFKQ